MEQAVKERINVEKLKKLPIANPNDPSKKLSEKEEQHLREIVSYEFMNLEEPGLSMKFSYGNASNKHTFTLFHGGKYNLPRFIARHVESKSTPMWSWRPDGAGSIRKEMTGRKSRFQMREVY